MEQTGKPDPSMRDAVAPRCSSDCDLSRGIWAPGGLICRVKFLTLLALIGFLALASLLGWF